MFEVKSMSVGFFEDIMSMDCLEFGYSLISRYSTRLSVNVPVCKLKKIINALFKFFFFFQIVLRLSKCKSGKDGVEISTKTQRKNSLLYVFFTLKICNNDIFLI